VKANLTPAYRNRHGNLWFASNLGASRLVPSPEARFHNPSSRITALRIKGVEHPLSKIGETTIGRLELRHDENNIEIEFSGVDFMTGTPLLYQYRMEGSDADWSIPTDRRR
jgi:hypothetical protein